MSLLQKSNSIEVSRRTQQFQAKKQAYKLGNMLQVEVDTQREFIDMKSLRLVYELHDTGTTATGKSTNPWTASSLIKNLRIKTLGGQLIGHEIREYRGWFRFVKKMGTSNLEARTSYQDNMEGALGGDNLGGDTTAGYRQYAHKFDCVSGHILGLEDYYPAHFHQGLIIEIDLSDNAYEIMKYTIAPASSHIEVQEARIVCDLVQVKPEIENEMIRLMEEQKLFVDYIETHQQQSNPINAGSPYPSDEIVGIDGRVKSCFFFQVSGRANGTSDYWGDDNAGTSAMGRNGLDNYRFRLGSRYINYSNINLGSDKQAEQTMELAKALDVHSKDQAGDSAKTYALSDTAFFGVGAKVDKAQQDVNEVISSEVDKDRNNLRVELTGTATATAVGYNYVALDKRLQLLSGSIVRSVRN